MTTRISRRRRPKSPVKQGLMLETLEGRQMLTVFTVDTGQDLVDPADGRTSLREAILAASAQAGADQIVFDFGHTRPATLLLEQGELQMADALTIRGPGSARLTIDAQQRSRIFNITAASGDFAIEGLAIVNGRSFGEGGALRSNSTVRCNCTMFRSPTVRSRQKGLRVEASGRGSVSATASTISGNKGTGIDTSGSVAVSSSTISGNAGTGISALGSVTVSSSTVSGNSGYGISTSGDVTVSSSTISGNAGTGVNASGTATVSSSRISDNAGNGINASVAVTVSASTVSGSSGTGINTGGSVTVSSSTISQNVNVGIIGSGIVTVSFSTISGNWAEDGGGGGIRASGSTTISIANSIVAANQGGNSPDLDLQDFSGTLTVQRSLIGDKGNTGLEEAPPGTPDANGNLIGGPVGGAIDPRLGPLTDNGGTTWTHWLLPDSPAIDRGDPAAQAGVDGVPQFDQRGQPYGRVVHGRIDIGAHERHSLTATIVNVTSPMLDPTDSVTIQFTQPVSGFGRNDLTLSRNGGSDNLLAGVAGVRLRSSDGQTYVLSGLKPITTWAGYYTLTLIVSGSGIQAADGTPLDAGTSTSWVVGRATLGLTVDTLVDELDGRIDDGDISLRDALDAVAPGETIDFAPALDGGTLLLTQGELRITRSTTLDATALEHGLVIDASGSDPTPDVYDGQGSRVIRIDDDNRLADSPVTLRGLTLTRGDVAGDGGAALAQETVSIESTVISRNSAGGKGGGIRARGLLTVHSSTISGNSAPSGGGIDAGGSVTVTSSTISENAATAKYTSSGGIHAGGSVTVTSSTISGNSITTGVHADGCGGILASSVMITSSTISGNLGSLGGGICGAEVTVSSSTISGNSTSRRGPRGGGISASHSAIVTSSTISGNSGDGILVSGDVTVRSSTISGNSWAGIRSGGSVTVVSSTISGNGWSGISASGSVTVNSSTISGNKGSGIDTSGSVAISSSTISGNWAEDNRVGGIRASGDTISIANSIVAANRGGGSPDLDLQDFSGTLTLKQSLIGDTGNSGLAEAPLGAPDAQGNLMGGPTGGAIDPRLAPLADNGGPTWTHALLPDSPAIDRGDPGAVAGVDGVPLFDQRGQPYARVAHGRIDMGAHERQSLTASIVSVPSPALTPVDAVTIQFSQPVVGFDLSDLTLSRNGLMGNLLTGNEHLESSDGQTYVLSGLTGSVSWAGYYTFTLTLTVSGSQIQAVDGSPLDAGTTTSWVMHREPLGLTVDTLLDERDGWIDDGDISLRDALDAAAPGETIHFAPRSMAARCC